MSVNYRELKRRYELDGAESTTRHLCEALAQRELARRAPTKVEFFEASLESARFEESVSEGPFVDYLSALFRNQFTMKILGGFGIRLCMSSQCWK